MTTKTQSVESKIQDSPGWYKRQVGESRSRLVGSLSNLTTSMKQKASRYRSAEQNRGAAGREYGV